MSSDLPKGMDRLKEEHRKVIHLAIVKFGARLRVCTGLDILLARLRDLFRGR